MWVNLYRQRCQHFVRHTHSPLTIGRSRLNLEVETNTHKKYAPHSNTGGSDARAMKLMSKRKLRTKFGPNHSDTVLRQMNAFIFLLLLLLVTM